jgi:hypothetical protein
MDEQRYDDLAVVLASVGESECLAVLREEELDLPLLASMAPARLRENLLDLGLSATQAEKVAVAVASTCAAAERAASACEAEEPTERGAFASLPAVASSVPPPPQPDAFEPPDAWEQLVHSLQVELFAEDLSPPAEARSWSPGRLRAYFESGGADSGPSVSPACCGASACSGASGGSCAWHGGAAAPRAPVPRLGVRLGGSSSSSASTNPNPNPNRSPTPPAAWSTEVRGCAAAVAASEAVGSLAVRWQGHDYAYAYGAGSRVADLKAWLHL